MSVSANPASEVLREVAPLATLANVFTWGRSRPGGCSSPTVILDVVVQDEFTHDAIVPISDGLVVVFGST